MKQVEIKAVVEEYACNLGNGPFILTVSHYNDSGDPQVSGHEPGSISGGRIVCARLSVLKKIVEIAEASLAKQQLLRSSSPPV